MPLAEAMRNVGLGDGAGAALAVSGLGERFGDRGYFQGCVLRGGLRRGVRLPRPERCWENDDGADAPVLILGAALLIVDGLGWRIVAPAFNRERLITGTK